MINTLFIDRVREYKNIVIYGAGMVGSLVYKQLLANGFSVKNMHFAVSEAISGQTFYDMPVAGIKDLCASLEDYIVIVSVLKKNQTQLLALLDELKVKERIVIDEQLYSELEEAYARECNMRKPLKESSYDVMFMSSDSNISSGAVLCLVDINVELKKRGVATFVVFSEYGQAEELLIKNDIDYTYVLSDSWLVSIDTDSSVPDFQKNSSAIKKLKDLIQKYNVKYVHNNSVFTYVGGAAAKDLGIPYLWHVREFIREQGFWFYDEKYAFELMNASKYIITISDYVGSCYPKLDKDKIQRIYDGVDTNRFYNRHDLFHGETLMILMPGNIIPLKGQEQLIYAAALLKERGIDFRITFIGSGDADYIRHLRDLIKLHDLGDEILFMDRTSEMEKHYSNADIVVVCSKSEAFGRVTVEAQLSGCVVIGADCGATTELVKDSETGYLYPYGDTEKLAEIIVYVQNNRHKSIEVATNGQTSAKVNYSKESNAEKIYELYTGANYD